MLLQIKYSSSYNKFYVHFYIISKIHLKVVSTTSSWSKRTFLFFDSKEGKNEKFGSSKEEKKKKESRE